MRFLLSKSTGEEGVCMTGWGEHRWYYVIFLLQEKTKRVFIDISFSKDLKKVLRKHWQGNNPETREFFSMENPDALPQMHVWKAGNMPRPKALVYLEKWKTVFAEAGYAVYGSGKAKWSGKPYNVFTREDERVLRKISVELFKQGKEFRMICCEEIGEIKKAAHQKYYAGALDETLNIRTNSEIACAFRQYCIEQELTQSQGLMQLLEGKTEERGMLEKDLQARLDKADRIIEEQKEMISGLRLQLKQARTNPDAPKKLERADLRKQLLKEFFNRLPEAEYAFYAPLQQHSRRQIEAIFEDLPQYRLPTKSEIILMTVEGIGYGKRNLNPLFVYGRTADGAPVKLRWYNDRAGKFGESIWNSRFFVKGSQWLFAIQKTGEASNIVGSLPVIDEIVMAICMGATVDEDCPEKTEEYDIDDYVREADELDRLYNQNHAEPELQFLDDDMPAYSGANKLDDLIIAADKHKPVKKKS